MLLYCYFKCINSSTYPASYQTSSLYSFWSIRYNDIDSIIEGRKKGSGWNSYRISAADDDTPVKYSGIKFF